MISSKKSLYLRSWLLTIESHLYLFEEALRESLKDNFYVNVLVERVKKPEAMTLDNDIHLCSGTDPLVKKLIIYRGNYFSPTSMGLAINPKKTEHQDLSRFK